MSRLFPDLPATLPGALERVATHFPNRGVTVFEGRHGKSSRRTYPEVLAAARQAAGRWVALGVEPGDRILVALSTSWDWFDTWLGALLCGALPVAVAPGAAMGAAETHVRKLDELVQRLGARYVVVPGNFRSAAQELGAEHAAAAAISGAEFAATAPAHFTAPRCDSDDVAFLQLTSGSTGLPRAVRIRHSGAIHNASAIDEGVGAPLGSPSHEWMDSVVAWLPLHHDMGLLGCLFLAILNGCDLYLLQPTSFLARPKQWLSELGRHGRSYAPAPNFGFQLCLERLREKDLADLDLSSWQYTMAGAEMVRPEAVRGFCDFFAPCGFTPEKLRPCYGLAEGTLAVTIDQAGQGLRTRPLPAGATTEGFGLSEVACVGGPVRDTKIQVSDAAGHALAEGEIGEVRAQGPGIFAGYYQDEEATAESLQEGWLLTGDLGFLHQGELYLTGRTKDLLIVHGTNVMPHEIEWLADSVTGGGGAARSGAFSIARSAAGEEAILVVEALDRDPEKLQEMGHEIRARVGRTLSLPLADLVFVRRGKIPKTTSGKVQRRQLKALFLNGQLERL